MKSENKPGAGRPEPKVRSAAVSRALQQELEERERDARSETDPSEPPVTDGSEAAPWTDGVPDTAEEKAAGRLRRTARRIRRWQDDRVASRDVIYLERLHGKTPEETVLTRGSIDPWFFLWSLLLVCFGALMNYSASAVYAESNYGDSAHFLKNYLLYTALAAAVSLFFVLYATPTFLRFLTLPVFGGSCALLLLVLVIGSTGGGAQRWIRLGPITIQPSEIAKFAMVLALALYLSRFEDKITSPRRFGGSFLYGVVGPFAIIGTFAALIMLEKHISCILILGMLGVAMMFLGGTKIRYLLLMGLAVACGGVGLVAVSDYAQVRVNTWLHIYEVNPLGEAWQTLQGLNAIGSGGLFGLGLGNSRQKFGYVSQPQNDFIFTIVCEELGFFGALLVAVLFLCFVFRAFQIASRAPDRFSALLVWGLALKVALQTVLNLAVVTNSMPNTGISLPFFSSGGTALMMQIFEVGVILTVSRYGRLRKR